MTRLIIKANAPQITTCVYALYKHLVHTLERTRQIHHYAPLLQSRVQSVRFSTVIQFNLSFTAPSYGWLWYAGRPRNRFARPVRSSVILNQNALFNFLRNLGTLAAMWLRGFWPRFYVKVCTCLEQYYLIDVLNYIRVK